MGGKRGSRPGITAHVQQTEEAQAKAPFGLLGEGGVLPTRHCSVQELGRVHAKPVQRAWLLLTVAASTTLDAGGFHSGQLTEHSHQGIDTREVLLRGHGKAA